MEYIKKLLQALLDTLVPPGTIIMYGGSEVPDGYILIQNVKVYEDEFPRLYPVLAACSGLEKGNDSGRAWVKMPNPDGRVPQFTTSGSLVWKLLEASLPNIRGEFHDLASATVASLKTMGSFTGCFVQGDEDNFVYRCTSTEKIAEDGDGIAFEPSRSSAIYAGTKLQPEALQVLACIRV